MRAYIISANQMIKVPWLPSANTPNKASINFVRRYSNLSYPISQYFDRYFRAETLIMAHTHDMGPGPGQGQGMRWAQ